MNTPPTMPDLLPRPFPWAGNLTPAWRSPPSVHHLVALAAPFDDLPDWRPPPALVVAVAHAVESHLAPARRAWLSERDEALVVVGPDLDAVLLAVDAHNGSEDGPAAGLLAASRDWARGPPALTMGRRATARSGAWRAAPSTRLPPSPRWRSPRGDLSALRLRRGRRGGRDAGRGPGRLPVRRPRRRVPPDFPASPP
jgi:hypothetical protein